MIKSKQLFLTLVIAFLYHLAFAQLYVDPEGNAGLGVQDSPDARMTISNNTEMTGLFLNHTAPNIQFGIDNLINSTGTGIKYGIRSTINQLSTATTKSYGHYVNMLPEGTGTAYGLYSNVEGGGDGIRYSFYGYGASPNGSTKDINGMYSKIVGSGSGNAIGIENLVGLANPTNNTANAYGIFNFLSGLTSGTQYGIYSVMDAENSPVGDKYGIYSVMLNGGNTTGNNIGLYSQVTIGEGYAGYFEGDVQIMGNLTWGSDENLKENIRDIDNALTIIEQLTPKRYNFKTTKSFGPENPQDQFGFIAQDVEQVMPSIVRDITRPALVVPTESGENIETTEATTPENLKSMDYTALIAILMQGIKDQQVEIEALKVRVEELENN